MKYKIYFLAAILLAALQTKAQQFINKGTIEFEVITNIKKTMPDVSYLNELKESMPTFKTAYFDYTFADNKSIYKFTHYDEKKAKIPEFFTNGDDDNEWYSDFNTGINYVQKSIWNSPFNLKDSIKDIQWKLSNESRMIAGFNCRKAVGKIMDSVYVFAFYTDEITISGGPCTIHGLPGMILGVTIPRLYMSILATKLMVNDVKTDIIKPTAAKKYYTPKELKDVLAKRWQNDGDEGNEENKKWKEQMYWNLLL